MTATEWLLWARGPAFEIATVILVMGIIVRLIEILMLGRKENLAAPRGSATAGGLRTIVICKAFPRCPYATPCQISTGFLKQKR